ncbi:MAG: TonB-dependent receptor [Sediminibacterium sp.]|nr:TonB-dependent receptor [Sediminibacterium sp.]
MQFRIYILFLLLLLAPLWVYSQLKQNPPLDTLLNTVIVTASKTKEKRIESPIAISLLSNQQIQEAKATRIDFLLNKVSGVYMPTIGNEQHMMSIRQPVSLKGLYLYLEDGVPIRTSGLFSNNALIEINTAAIHQIEIIKGPASALYGAEAIGGVVNFIHAPRPTKNQLSISNHINNNGLLKSDLLWNKAGKQSGWALNMSQMGQKNGLLEYSDYTKTALSLKRDFAFKKKWSGYQQFQYIHYDGQMTGTVDSLKFQSKNYSTQQSFTFRKLDLIRLRQNLSYQWNEAQKTSINLLYRGNTMDQNPAYLIAASSNPTKFKGQINSNHFDAYVVDLQHQINLKSLKSKILIGGYMDATLQGLVANYIDIVKDTAINKFTRFTRPAKDSIITNYKTTIYNKAMYMNWIQPVIKNIRVNATLRYDQFNYQFKNRLSTGTPSANNIFTNWAPKLGATYNQPNWGGYFNYSKGFVPPQITEIYNAVRVPYLLPQSFSNVEIGNWIRIPNGYLEWSLYQLNGRNEIVSVRQADGVNLNQNTGQTKHYGIEYQLKYNFGPKLQFNFNGSNAKHVYINTVLKGTDISDKEMVAAPRFFSNLTLLSQWSKAFSSSIEWQHQSSYFMDEINATRYPGFNVLNLRVNYTSKQHEFWLQCMNLTDQFYASMATKNFSVKGNSAYAYYLGDNRNIAIGWKWNIIP